jgi:cell division transport system permease protein
MLVSFLRPGLFISFAILIAAGLAVALGASGLAGRAANEAAKAASAYTVRVLAPASEDALAKAVTALAAAPGVRTAQPMDADRAAQLLTRWGGRPINAADLPPLRLIEVRLAEPGDSGRTPALLTERLRTAGVAAEIYDAGPADPGRPAAVRLATIAGAGVCAAFLLALYFAAAAAARAERTRATLWADLGATRAATLAAFGRAGAEIAFLAGAAAVILALVAAPGVRMAAGETISFATMIASLSSWDVLIALAAPLLAAAAASFGARTGAASAFDAADRLG